MKASETNILKFMEGQKQFQIPIYQREYKWEISHCKELLLNIHEIMNEELENHFIGSVVYIQDSIYQSSSLPKLFVIDGQQRITTISLLLLAIAKLNPEIKDKIYDLYLINKYDENNKYKLLSKENDHKVYIKLLNDLDLDNDDDKKTHIYKNFSFFIKEIKTKEQSQKVFDTLHNLFVVDVALDKDKDDPQKIFETLNSTGLRLKQSDMIRNFLLMSFDENEQKNIYNEYWIPIQSRIGEGHLDDFFRDFLISLTFSIPNKNNVFNDFKKFIREECGKKTPIEILQQIYKYSLYYEWILYHDDVKWIRELKAGVSYPFLLRIKNKFEANEIDKETLNDILELVESYIFRRKICGIPTNSLNKIFAKLTDISDLNYESHDNKRFPNDTEFKENLKKPIYGQNIDRYMLNKIENHYSKIEKNVDESSIEHIVPQKITDEWKKELGENWKEIHEKYLHRLGNLTLSEYNSEMGNKSFSDKLEYYKKSAFSINNYFRENEFTNGFNENEILKREEELINICLKIWTIPK